MSQPIASAAATVTIVSNDNHAFTVPEAVARAFPILSDILDDAGLADPVPLHNVSGAVLAKVIEFCTFRLANTLEDEAKTKAFNAEFFDVDIVNLCALIVAAHYLIAKDLLDSTSAAIAARMYGKNVEEIRNLFGIDSDYTPEEERAVMIARGYIDA